MAVLLYNAQSAKADIFITADFKYHEFFEAEDDIIIADIGHYESEQFAKGLGCRIAYQKILVDLPSNSSKVNTNLQ